MSGQNTTASATGAVTKKDPITAYEERVAKKLTPKADYKHVQEPLIHALSDIKRSNPRAAFEVLPTAINPGLFVNHVGHIRLPITKLDAEKIRAHNSHGRLSDETTNGRLSNTAWELKAGDFSLSNPAWQIQMDCFVNRARDALGIAASLDGIRVTLHKLVGSGKGDLDVSFGGPGQETSFPATLVICLPSPHTGGDIHVTRWGPPGVFRTSLATEFGYSFAVWYGEAHLEFKPIVTGHRIMLVYYLSLREPSPTLQALSLAGGSLEEARAVLSRWKSSYKIGDSGWPKELAYILHHTYLAGGLKRDLLNSLDKLVVDILREACEKEGFVLYLARLEREVQGLLDSDVFYDYEDYEDIPKIITDSAKFHSVDPVRRISFKLCEVCEIDGTEIAKELNFNGSNIARSSDFEKIAEREEFGGFRCDGEFIIASHFYSKTVAVVVPHDRTMAFRFLGAKKGKVDAATWIQNLLDELERVKSATEDESRESFPQVQGLLAELQTPKSDRRPGPLDGLHQLHAYDKALYLSDNTYDSDPQHWAELDEDYDSCDEYYSSDEDERDAMEHSLVRHGRERLKEPEEPEEPAKRLDRLCRMCIEHNKTTKHWDSAYHHHVHCPYYSPYKPLSDEVLGKIAEASLVLKDIGLFRGAFGLIRKSPPVSVFKSVGKALHFMDDRDLLDAAKHALSCFKKPSLRWRAISNVVSSYTQSGTVSTISIATLHSWQRARVEEMFKPETPLGKEDMSCILTIKGKYGESWFLQNLLPTLRHNSKQSALMAGILPHLIETYSNKIPFPQEIDRLIEDAIESLSIRSKAELLSDCVSTSIQKDESSEKPSLVESTDLIKLTTACHRGFHNNRYFSSLMRMMNSTAKKASAKSFEEILLPYMDLLLEYLTYPAEPELIETHQIAYSQFFQTALSNYVKNHVGVEPNKSKDWIRSSTIHPLHSCTCRDCIELKAFLAMPNAEDWTFNLSFGRRIHLEKQCKSVDVIVDAIERGTRHHVSIVKGDEEFCTKWSAWKEKFDSTMERFREMEKKGPLKKLLGDHYDETMLLKGTKSPVAKKPLVTSKFVEESPEYMSDPERRVKKQRRT